MNTSYEYAGFQYIIQLDDNHWRAVPAPGQHSAAGKDKHCMAAVECYLNETARIMQDDGLFVVHLGGQPCPPTFNSRGAAKAYRDMCIRERRIRA